MMIASCIIVPFHVAKQSRAWPWQAKDGKEPPPGRPKVSEALLMYWTLGNQDTGKLLTQKRLAGDQGIFCILLLDSCEYADFQCLSILSCHPKYHTHVKSRSILFVLQ